MIQKEENSSSLCWLHGVIILNRIENCGKVETCFQPSSSVGTCSCTSVKLLINNVYYNVHMHDIHCMHALDLFSEYTEILVW
jgi:hypothetical protein